MVDHAQLNEPVVQADESARHSSRAFLIPETDDRSSGVRIGGVELTGRTVLAPLAGVTDRSFRTLCREQGASLAVTEMVSARGLVHGGERSSEYLDFRPDEAPISVQVFGSDPDVMAAGAAVVAEREPDLIDINCGCPVKKIVNRNAGAALMREPEKLGEIVSAMCEAVSAPITVKIRSGWDREENAPEVARVVEDAGAAAIAVHGRSRASRFKGRADWDVIRRVKEAVGIPVSGNGDVRSSDDAERMVEETGCDLVMVGRWAIGNPWLFGRIERRLSGMPEIDPPTIGERMEVAIDHLWRSVDLKGRAKGVYELRNHLAAYVKGIESAVPLRRSLLTEGEPEEVERILRHVARTEGDLVAEDPGERGGRT